MTHFDFASLSGFSAAILLYMSIVRIFLGTQRYGIPIMNFVSFSNILAYVLDVLYGLTGFIIVTSIIFLFRIEIYKLIVGHINCTILGLSFGNILIVLSFLFAATITFIYWGKRLRIHKMKLNKCRTWILKISLYLLIGLIGFFAKFYCAIQETSLLILSMVFIFSWLFTKVVVQYELDGWEDDSHCITEISFKDGRDAIISNENVRYVANTMEFVFMFDKRDNSYIAYPMSEIRSLKNNGVDISMRKRKCFKK